MLHWQTWRSSDLASPWNQPPMSTITVADAQAHFLEILAGLGPGEQVIIVNEGVQVATLIRSRPTSWPCKAGSAKDTVHWMASDFDAPLDFRPS